MYKLEEYYFSHRCKKCNKYTMVSSEITEKKHDIYMIIYDFEYKCEECGYKYIDRNVLYRKGNYVKLLEVKEMISAKEARVLTDSFISEDDKYQLEDIEKCINNCIRIGCVYYYNRLSIIVKERLEELGYLVGEQDNQKDGYIAVISW